MHEVPDCYVCGDGIEQIGGGWRHIDDSISAEGERVVSTCYWGKPYAPSDNRNPRFADFEKHLT
ncbi:hypothetical protein [Mycobacterium sp. AZCC_0083]|uniref:hypothetical protein n=1 Tax=Mycobacterium sp. AZCC_0083 TaxID=2735882 RepID=UPI00160DFD38|nr:hypothetical protein [Mycobacterium sp. AZCC_0083]MBB5167183.1 hypothetical protein [Mycobacterium sp. AZCC_0083]